MLEGRDFLETTHVRSHLYLLPVISYPYILTSISPSYRKAAQIPDSKASSLSLSIPASVRGVADPEIEMTAQLLCFIGDIDVKEDSFKNGLWMYF